MIQLVLSIKNQEKYIAYSWKNWIASRVDRTYRVWQKE